MNNPFWDACINGPYLARDRYIVGVKRVGQRHTTTTYARYVMACHLGRLLDPEEEVVFVTGDGSSLKNDYHPENLKLVGFQERREALMPKMHSARWNNSA